MRVLLVEDDPRIGSDVARVLEAAGYLVETVRDGEEFIDLVSAAMQGRMRSSA